MLKSRFVKIRQTKVDKIVKYICFAFFGYIFINYLIIRPIILNKNHRYSIAKIIEIKGAVNGGPDADFEYKVNNKKYTGFIDLGNKADKVKVGYRYLIKYHPKNPKNAAILINEQINDSTMIAPMDGWKEKP